MLQYEVELMEKYPYNEEVNIIYNGESIKIGEIKPDRFFHLEDYIIPDKEDIEYDDGTKMQWIPMKVIRKLASEEGFDLKSLIVIDIYGYFIYTSISEMNKNSITTKDEDWELVNINNLGYNYVN